MKIPPRQINGVFLLDKDSGVSSNHALQQVKRLFNAAKAGHTGSLDPLASGVLPICFGEATKFARFLLDADKTYLVTAKLGVITASGDAEGNIIATNPVPSFTKEHIEQAISKFLGASKQIPSMFSALKHNGQPLYKLARQNITVDREPRDIYIYKFDLLEFTGDTISCEVKCSKGTYIRSLIEDLGMALGCGAHVTALRRVAAGPFTIEHAWQLAPTGPAACDTLFLLRKNKGFASGVTRNGAICHDLISEKLLLPIESLLTGISKICLTGADSLLIRNGRQIHLPESTPGITALWSHDNTLLGIGEATNDGNIVPLRLVATHADVL